MKAWYRLVLRPNERTADVKQIANARDWRPDTAKPTETEVLNTKELYIVLSRGYLFVYIYTEEQPNSPK